MLALKPSIGWYGYMLIRRSSTTFTVGLLLLLCVISIFLVRRSQESLSLQFMTPAPGSSPFIILPPPSYYSFNSFDACAVESAISPPLPTTDSAVSTTKGMVHLYLWYSNVGPSDVWVKFLSQLKGVKISFLNLVKSLRTTPIQGMLASGGWGGRPDWAIWLASGGSLLWRSGGIIMPNGVIMTKPLTVEAFGNNTGVFITKNNKVTPTLIGSPPHHLVLENILHNVDKFDYSLYSSNNEDLRTGSGIENLLTKAVTDVCDLNNLKEGDCNGFSTIKSDLVFDLTLDKPSSLKEEAAYFLRYTGDPDLLKYDIARSQKFFRKHGLFKYCPAVYRFLNNEARISL